MNNKCNKNNRLNLKLLHMGGVLSCPSKVSTQSNNLLRSITMIVYQTLRDNMKNSVRSLSHNIYCGTLNFLRIRHIPLELIIALKALGYLMTTVLTMVSIYYILHIVCLINDRCYNFYFGGL